MSGGHNNHVDNSVWSRAILMAGAILTIGIVAFAALGLGVGSVKHDTYDEAKTAYYDAMDDPTVSDSELDKLHHEEIDAHLSYLTYWVAGITILIIQRNICYILGYWRISSIQYNLKTTITTIIMMMTITMSITVQPHQLFSVLVYCCS